MRDAGHRTPDIGHRITDIGHRTAEKAKIIYPPPRGVDIIKYFKYLIGIFCTTDEGDNSIAQVMS